MGTDKRADSAGVLRHRVDLSETRQRLEEETDGLANRFLMLDRAIGFNLYYQAIKIRAMFDANPLKQTKGRSRVFWPVGGWTTLVVGLGGAHEETPGRPKFPHLPLGGLTRIGRSGGALYV